MVNGGRAVYLSATPLTVTTVTFVNVLPKPLPVVVVGIVTHLHRPKEIFVVGFVHGVGSAYHTAVVSSNNLFVFDNVGVRMPDDDDQPIITVPIRVPNTNVLTHSRVVVQTADGNRSRGQHRDDSRTNRTTEYILSVYQFPYIIRKTANFHFPHGGSVV